MSEVNTHWEVVYFCTVSCRDHIACVAEATDAQDAVDKARIAHDGNTMQVRTVTHVTKTPYLNWE
jgi:hypothetical protein